MQDENSLKEIFSLRLSGVMSDKSFTQKDLSNATEIAQSAISKYIAGKGLPRTLELYKISIVLGVSMDWLLGVVAKLPEKNSLLEENIQLRAKLDMSISTLKGALKSLTSKK